MLNIGIVCFGILSSILILNMTYTSTDNSTQAETVAPIQEINGYMLKEYDGKIGVFRTSSDKPYTYIDDIDISYLTEYDRELLTKGIEVNTEDELKALIEDLTS